MRIFFEAQSECSVRGTTVDNCKIIYEPIRSECSSFMVCNNCPWQHCYRIVVSSWKALEILHKGHPSKLSSPADSNILRKSKQIGTDLKWLSFKFSQNFLFKTQKKIVIDIHYKTICWPVRVNASFPAGWYRWNMADVENVCRCVNEYVYQWNCMQMSVFISSKTLTRRQMTTAWLLVITLQI